MVLAERIRALDHHDNLLEGMHALNLLVPENAARYEASLENLDEGDLEWDEGEVQSNPLN